MGPAFLPWQFLFLSTCWESKGPTLPLVATFPQEIAGLFWGEIILDKQLKLQFLRIQRYQYHPPARGSCLPSQGWSFKVPIFGQRKRLTLETADPKACSNFVFFGNTVDLSFFWGGCMLIDEIVQKLACICVFTYVNIYLIHIYTWYIYTVYIDICISVFVCKYIYICIFMVARFIDLLLHVLFTYPRLKQKNRRLHIDYNMIQRIATSGRWTEVEHWLTQYVTFNHPNCWECFFHQ